VVCVFRNSECLSKFERENFKLRWLLTVAHLHIKLLKVGFG